MPEQFTDRVDVLDGASGATISLNANRATVQAGGSGTPGRLLIRAAGGEELVEVSVRDGSLTFRDAEGETVLRFISGRGTLDLGGRGTPGRLSVHDDRGRAVIQHDARDARVRVGVEGAAGAAEATDGRGIPTVRLDGAGATVVVGAEGQGGALKVLTESGGLLFQVAVSSATLRGALIVGARDVPGSIAVMDPVGRPALVAEGGTARLQLGNIGNAGDLVLLDNTAKPVLVADGLTATLAVGGDDRAGSVAVRDGDGVEAGRLSGQHAALFLGHATKAGEILVLNAQGKAGFSVDGATGVVSVGTGDTRVVLDGQVGDIRLAGADCAEDFVSIDAARPEPGTVMVIADDSAIGCCTMPYDRRVAGVVSGAGGARPGIILNQHDEASVRVPLALSGRVFCKVDAEAAPIAIGDLLTTSSTPGHAMRACDAERSHGAILGKALRPLERGTGLIPVLISLI